MIQQQDCPVSRTVSLISGKWKPVLLFLIGHQVNRFSLLEKEVTGISKKVLTSQLRSLEKYGLISRQVRKSKHPQVVVYSLTASGQALLKLMGKLFEWGTVNLLDEPVRKIAKKVKEGYMTKSM